MINHRRSHRVSYTHSLSPEKGLTTNTKKYSNYKINPDGLSYELNQIRLEEKAL